MPKNYLLFVDQDRHTKVEIWPTINSDGTSNYDYPKEVTVATREHSSDIWGPPVYLREEN